MAVVTFDCGRCHTAAITGLEHQMTNSPPQSSSQPHAKLPAKLPTKLSVVRLFHGEVLFHAGREAQRFYLVRTGCITVLDKSGWRIKTSFSSGDLLGIPEVLAGGNWSLTAVADGPATVQPFCAARLFQSLEDMPDAHSDFLRHIAAMA